jgi:hypothetical protein
MARQDGRARSFQMKYPPDQIWELAKPFLRDPVKRSVWVSNATRVNLPRPPLAGLSALAFYSIVTEPSRPIYAVSTAQWKMAERAGAETLPESQPETSQWQIWSYAPNLLKQNKAVDPLSLTLSLQDDPDDRVQQALADLRGKFPW